MPVLWPSFQNMRIAYDPTGSTEFIFSDGLYIGNNSCFA